MEDSANFELSWLPKAPGDFSKQCRSLGSQTAECGAAVRKLAGYRLDTNQLLSLSKAIERVRSEGVSLAPLRPYRLGLISNSTSDFVTGALTATAARHGIDLECIAAGYDQAVQESLDAHSAVNSSAPDGVLIAIDWRGLPILPSPGDSERGVETLRASIAHLRLMATGIRQNTKATCIFQTLAAPPEALFGSLDRLLPGTTRWLIDEINRAIRDLASETEGIVVDIAGAAETVGLANWHSPEQWNIAKLAFSQDYAPLYAEYVCRAISAVRGATRRCLVLDLDNTLWGGVIGDDGVNGIRVAQGDADGEAYLALQSYILALRNRGVVLAVSSKNEDETARSPFREHPDMVLREEHFAIFQANWNDKPTNIRAIAQELSLGLDSFVFVDDNPFERELVRQSLPEVAVPEMPEDPARYARTLAAAGYFESVVFSEEDRKRASYYEGNARRAALQKQVTDLEAYLASLKMEITFQPFNEVGRARIAQLINKSNQFNLTTKRYTESDVARMEADPSYFTLQVRLTDVYGDNGMISVIICRKDSTAEWEIDLWLMSCRVLGRRVENMALRELVGHARRAGVQTLTGAYIPTARNKLVERHYASLGFNQVRGAKDGATLWELDTHVDLPTFPMTVRSLGFPETAMPAGRFF